MNKIRAVGLFLLLLGGTLPGWTQKKGILKTTANVITGDVVPTGVRPYAQLLADTKALINQTGYRPRACITDERGFRILARNMTPQQHAEVHLAEVIARRLSAFKRGELDPNDPDLKELQTLVESHPNPRNTQPDAAQVQKRQALELQARIDHISQKAHDYVQTHGTRPRSTIFRNGSDLRLHEIKREYPQEYEEIVLGKEISRLLGWGKKHAPDHPQINALRQFLSAYSIKSNTPAPAAILLSLREFIAAHNRLPRKVIIKNGVRLSPQELSEQEQQEMLLANQIHNVLYPAKNNAFEQQDPDAAQIKQEITHFHTQSIQRLLDELLVFLDTHNRFPRSSIIHNGRRFYQRELSEEEQAEKRLKFRLLNVIYAPPEKYAFSQSDKALIEEIKRLRAFYNSPMPTPEELLAQAEAWVQAHAGMRPRKAFRRNGQTVPVRTLSREQYEEVTLARRINYTVSRATEITPSIEGLQAILQLPLRPQLPHEIPPLSQEETQAPYDDFEEYFR